MIKPQFTLLDSFNRKCSQTRTGSGSLSVNDIPLSSISTSGETDFPSTTDLTDLSIDSPEPSQPLKKSARGAFARAQTFAGQIPAAPGTPMDVEMSEPSPISIASLSLSPRRNGGTKAPVRGNNIFEKAAEAEARWRPTLMNSDDEEDDDDTPVLPSPTRQKPSRTNPFLKANRPPLFSQKTAPIPRQNSQPNIFGKAATASQVPTMGSVPDLRNQTSNAALRERSTSPNRRLVSPIQEIVIHMMFLLRALLT